MPLSREDAAFLRRVKVHTLGTPAADDALATCERLVAQGRYRRVDKPNGDIEFQVTELGALAMRVSVPADPPEDA